MQSSAVIFGWKGDGLNFNDSRRRRPVFHWEHLVAQGKIYNPLYWGESLWTSRGNAYVCEIFFVLRQKYFRSAFRIISCVSWRLITSDDLFHNWIWVESGCFLDTCLCDLCLCDGGTGRNWTGLKSASYWAVNTTLQRTVIGFNLTHDKLAAHFIMV